MNCKVRKSKFAFAIARYFEHLLLKAVVGPCFLHGLNFDIANRLSFVVNQTPLKTNGFLVFSRQT